MSSVFIIINVLGAFATLILLLFISEWIIHKIKTRRRVIKYESFLKSSLFYELYSSHTHCVKFRCCAEELSKPLYTLRIQIGCVNRTIIDWDYFFSDDCEEVINTKRNDPYFKEIEDDYLIMRKFVVKLQNKHHNNKV